MGKEDEMDNRLIRQLKDFDLEHIADSGQCFRMEKTGENKYSNVAFGRYVEIEKVGDETFAFSCTQEEYNSIWKRYFDLEVDYSRYKAAAGSDEFLRQAIKEGGGIRILRQELWEMMVTFIISANNNIPRIKGAVSKISARWGERKTAEMWDGRRVEFHAFPTPEAMAAAEVRELRDCGLGYRDDYVACLAKETAASEGKNLEKIQRIKDYQEAVKALTEMKGVGVKVANCIALFGLHIMDAYPEDTWMKAMIKDVYGGSFDTAPYQGFEGYIQQLQFYCYRKQVKSGRRQQKNA